MAIKIRLCLIKHFGAQFDRPHSTRSRTRRAELAERYGWETTNDDSSEYIRQRGIDDKDIISSAKCIISPYNEKLGKHGKVQTSQDINHTAIWLVFAWYYMKFCWEEISYSWPRKQNWILKRRSWNSFPFSPLSLHLLTIFQIFTAVFCRSPYIVCEKIFQLFQSIPNFFFNILCMFANVWPSPT